MNKINLHIFGSKIFFDILNELDFGYDIIFHNKSNIKIQNDLLTKSIKIIFIENFSLTELNFFLKENIPSILFVNDKKIFQKNKLPILSFHNILELPIDLFSFKEILKILIIKYNFFKQSKVAIKQYQIDSNQRIISKNNLRIRLTEKELKLILFLHEKNGIHKSVLLKKVWNYHSSMDSHAFETHLHRLRKKINKYFKDKDFIIEKNSFYYLSK